MNTEYLTQLGCADEKFRKLEDLMQGYVTNPSLKSHIIASYATLVVSGAFRDLVRNTLHKIRTDVAFSPDWISNTEFPLITNTKSAVSIRYFSPENNLGTVGAAPGSLILSLLSAQAIDVEVYHGAQETGRQSRLRRVTVRQDESVQIEAGQSFRIFAYSGPALLSRLLLDFGDYTAAYDAKTLEFISMLSLSRTSSRWYFMARVAGQMASEHAVPILRQLVSHENYYVRWTALQELFCHNVDEALEVLIRFKADPSIFIREQATDEVARIEKILASA